MALGLTQPLTEMSTRAISWRGCKGGRCVGVTTLPPSCADCLEILGTSTFWKPKVLSCFIFEVREATHVVGISNVFCSAELNERRTAASVFEALL
jgi:hypothetical protein